ncbi:MAG TPA: hypothetical protein VD996_09400 [Chitinophagaceae bacterium]|nr:hypothetical protein [Chitinophagaceae bacterium]
MRKFAIVLLIAAAVYACTQMQESASAPSSTNMRFCDSAGPGAGLCSYLPIDVDTSFGVGYDSDLDSARQRLFDIFSWQTFVALNWPADTNGRPVGNNIGDNLTAMRVWEYYRDPLAVFGGGTQEMMLHVVSARQQQHKFFYMDSKSPKALLPVTGFKEADGHPLIDRNLNFAVYEIRINTVEDTFITNHNLTTIRGIDSFYTASNNQFNLPASDSATGNPGSMEIKASWRILDPSKGDDTTRYYCRNAIIYIDSSSSMTRQPLVIRAKVGLVGIHIVRNTAKFSQNQIWSTFEHIDNTPDNVQEAQMDTTRKWSFYNPRCLNCPLNDTPAFVQGDGGRYRWNPHPPYAQRYAVKAPSQPALGHFGTQVVRVYPVYRYTQQINDVWQAKLKGTVWANYRLIGTQWQQAESFPPPNAPAFLGNTTLETYIQPTASCITCHGFATVPGPGGGKIRTDFSFLFPIHAK